MGWRGGGGLKNVLIYVFFIKVFLFLTGYMGFYQEQADQDQGQLLHHHRQHLLIEVENLRSLETGLQFCVELTLLYVSGLFH